MNNVDCVNRGSIEKVDPDLEIGGIVITLLSLSLFRGAGVTIHKVKNPGLNIKLSFIKVSSVN